MEIQTTISRSMLSSVLGIGQILTWGMTYYLPAILFAPLLSDMGWGKTHVGYAFTLSLVVSGICAPFVGRAVGQYSGKRVLMVGCVLNALGLIVMGLVSEYAYFLIAWAILGVGMSATLYIIAFSTLTEILGLNAHKSILTITLWGGFASTLAWPFGGYFIEYFGWRNLCFLYAVIFVIVILPIYQLGLPVHQQKKSSGADASPQKKLTMQDYGRSFITFTAIVMLLSYISGTLSLFLVIILIEGGSVATVAASIAALLGPSQIMARVIARLLSGRVDPIWTLLAANLLLMSGVVTVMVGGNFIVFGVIILGTGKGLISIIKGTVSLQLFGSKNYSVKIGSMERYVMFTQAAAPIISGLVFTVSGSVGLLGLMLCFAIIAIPLNLKLMRNK